MKCGKAEIGVCVCEYVRERERERERTRGETEGQFGEVTIWPVGTLDDDDDDNG